MSREIFSFFLRQQPNRQTIAELILLIPPGMMPGRLSMVGALSYELEKLRR
jgi:hypothetical protein